MATLIKSDLEFILQQILIAEQHAAGADLLSLLPNTTSMLGLRTVDGSFNNVVPGQEAFGAADQPFPTLLDPSFRPAEFGTTYAGTDTVVDSQPRTISNLIVDQTITNPAAVQAFVDGGFGILVSGVLHFLNADGTTGGLVPPGLTLTIPNTAPDEGLSAGFNSWFVFFGQFFDHGLDFIQRTTEMVVIPLAADDPIFLEHPDAPPVMVIERTVKDANGAALNHTTPFVDQNQTYTSHPSHQVFLREYVLNALGQPMATGKLITNKDLGADGAFGGTGLDADTELGGMATWAVVKAQARDLLGIELSDADVGRVPLVYTDPYGNFIPGANGLPQLITSAGPPPEFAVGDLMTIPPTLAQASSAIATGHAFIIDIAHNANPAGKVADGNNTVDPIHVPLAAGEYDDELLDAHFMAGDGRVNENIALVTVHHIFHSEHNRQIDAIQATILASGDANFIASWQLSPGVWDGERLFQAARFATEMQYQHLVFEEFARKVQPNVDEFLMYDATIDPAIFAEFAHTVYRFGHSMLTETVDRFDPNFASSEIGLIEAFLNPLAFDNGGALTAEEAAGAIVRGTTRQLGNEVDEFVTEALRNNLLGLPLDLATINLARGRETGIPSLNAARAEFFRGTSDSQLKPYISWVDLANNLKHPESIVNFIAAYGTHTSITSALTLAEKRAAADLLVFGGAGEPADRLDFLNSKGSWANGAAGKTTDFDGITNTGLGNIDLWIGGLAERQMPFGGLLGSTFNFVFETQMEALQNHDRFYYLGRLAGLNFLTEMENNSFAKLIMANTNATHLPGDVFSTPTWILEVDPTKQANDVDGNGALDIGVDPTGGTELLPLVIRDNPATPGLDTNYLRYTGADHVVLGGTNPGNLANPDGADILIGSEGDDTFWGDGGNDTIEGGAGNDIINGGDGDDILTDNGGDDNIKGGAGNDVIHGGQGLNLIIGGEGKDFIVTGEDISDTFGGQGDDFILGSKTNLPTLGNEGHDWIEIGTQDGAPGDNFDLLNLDKVDGHDVFIGGGGFDEMLGEGGGDIFIGSEGEDHFDGGSGFDWTSYKDDALGVSSDLLVNDFVEPRTTPSNAGILDRFAFVEGLSGSAHADILRGDNQQAADILTAGARGSVLDQEDIAFITGLQSLLGAGVTSFGSGNIILGGSGSDIIEGRAGNDIIDGDKWLNVRISVRANIDGTGAEIRSVNSMTELVQDMLAGNINPGQLVIQREILTGVDSFDTAVYSAPIANYSIDVAADGTVVVTDNRVVGVGVPITDGIDILRGIERLQFADAVFTAIPNPGGATNIDSAGALAISDTTPAVNQLLTVGLGTVTDANGGIAAGSVDFIWQVERIPGTGVFTDIIRDVGGSPTLTQGTSFRVTADLAGLSLRVRATFRDGNGTLENEFSAATTAVTGTVVGPAAPAAIPAESPTVSAGDGVHFVRGDLDFILQQVKIGEANSNAYGGTAQPLADLLPNSRVAFGIRTVDGSFNNMIPGQTNFGAADQNFPLQIPQQFRDVNGAAPGGNYASTVTVVDPAPRIISNLIVDQTANNPSAVNANGGAAPVVSPGIDGLFGTADDKEVFFIPNATPDAALSAPFNSWFTFFGQFFDHGLDLVDKGGAGSVFIPLMADDPLFSTAPGAANFMIVTRATNTAVLPGADGVLGTSDDIHRHNNETTPFIDQNQTYTSHASHQVFLREYALNAAGDPVATGHLLDGENGGIANWLEVKASAAQYLGIQLTDADVLDAPLLATDLYGKFIPGPNGFAQFVVPGAPGGFVEANPADNGGLGTPVPAAALRSGHAFLNDIAHTAAPVIVDGVLQNDPDGDTGNPVPVNAQGQNTQYDDELLDKHFITGDGRGNENIGLTSVHFVFHAEHNRLAEHVKDVAIASNDASFASEWLLTPISQAALDAINLLAGQAKADAIDALNWNGERIFQAARFGTEMQYQHLVFEEFARKVQPQVDIFFAPTQVYDTAINPAIVAEFAHVVYRFGHSMLTETIDRFDPSFNVIDADPLHLLQNGSGNQIGLIAAFLNPLAFTASGATDAAAAGAVIRGVTRQAGNEIDEFVTEALRNNLVGLPLDLPAINIARGRDTGVPTFNQARAEFYAMTGDSQLKPYTSWVDLATNLKHELSLVNFIAAYGTHSSITGAITAADKRAAADLLVFGDKTIDPDGIPGSGDEIVILAPTDRLAFLNQAAATSGVDAIDLWIGGLAEKQMPFGGLLGSTFNFVFETQMEKLQDGDRFYYLERTAGMNFLTELENNSFAKLIMANTNTTHLPGDVFSTPAFILEVNQSAQFNPSVIPGPDGILLNDPLTLVDESADNLLATDDPIGGIALEPLVLRSDPNNPGNPNYLEYNGVDHVVLGGTANNDTIIASIGDDTLYGDDGNDRLDGGDGVDMVLGGAGDDIITDLGGDDNIQGQDGNDAIHGGNGINLILAGFGNDFVVTGEDASESFGGVGNDFMLGVRANEFVFGNEGDDWIEVGMVDGAAGDNFDPFGRDLIRGNDVFIGEGLTDRMDGEGGDDIMVGNGGDGDRYEGLSGFDWAVFKDAPTGATADLTLRAFDATPLPPSLAVQARFTSVEGLSGSAHGDFLRGDNNTAVEIAVSGAYGSVLENIGLINGLQTFLDSMLDGDPNTAGDQAVTSFGAGNIIMGGAGSDLIEGRGGDDLIDGDVWLNVRMAGLDNLGAVFTADSMHELQARVFAGEINPGAINIVREILDGKDTDPTAANFDTALFTGALADYNVVDNGDGTWTITDTRGIDGTDTVRNIERLQFSDQALVLDGTNLGPDGLLTIDDTTPTENQLLSVDDITNPLNPVGVVDPTDPNNVTLTDPLGRITGPVTYFWQQEIRPGFFEDIVIINEAPNEIRATGLTFTPGDAQVGLALRVRAVYKDANGVLETVFSAPTAFVAGINDAPTGMPIISDMTPTETEALTASAAGIVDPDGTTTSVFAFEWQQANATGVGGGSAGFTTVATGPSFTPGPAQVNRELRLRVTYTDDQGFTNEVFSTSTTVTGDFIAANGAAQILNGNAGQDLIFGGGGADTLNGNAEADRLDGGAGADQINAGDGNDRITGGTGDDLLNGGLGADVFSYVFGDGSDIVDGGSDSDTLIINGTAGGNTLNVIWTGTSLTNFEGGSITSVETVTADLLGGVDTLSYAGSAAAVTADLSLGTASGFSASTIIPADGTIPELAARPAIAGIENVTGGTGADTLTGDANTNVLLGGGGADIITGGAGNDTVNGNAGNDRFVATVDDGNDSYTGNGGTDTYDLSATTAATIIAAILGGFTSSTSAQTGTDTLTTVDNLVGSQAVDRVNITAAAGAQTLDVVFDGAAITAFEAVTVSGVEEFTASLGGGNDTLSFAGSSAGVTVDLTAQTASGGFVSLVSVENVTGTAHADVLVGIAGTNNTLTGLAGSDTYTVHDAGDTVVETGGVGNGVDLVQATVSYTITDADVENLTLLGTGDINGTGNASANVITGNIGNNVLSGLGGADTISGGDGNDTLIGGTGLDLLIGGIGNDTFDFNATNESGVGAGNYDIIDDFQGAGLTIADIIDLTTIDANTNAGGNQNFAFIGTGAFSGAAQVRAVQVGNDTVLQLNTNGNTTNIEMELLLRNVTATTLVQGDFNL